MLPPVVVMGGASRIIRLRFPLLYSRLSALQLARHSWVAPAVFSPATAASASQNGFSFSGSLSRLGFSTSTRAEDHRDPLGSPPPHPWPEWLKLVDHVTAGGYVTPRVSSVGADDDDSFLLFEELPEDFLKVADACLKFARESPDLLGLLSSKDVEVVVENGSPFLFKNAMNSSRRMRSFLSTFDSDVMESEKAHTVDVMRYLLSYACNPLISSGESKLETRELIEASVRNLISELVNVSGTVKESHLPESMSSQSAVRYEQSSWPPRQNIEMKKGDWICPKCNFMNFARNMKCLECEEGRPKRQLTGGEWECPQCDFFNYGRNMVCLRCECKRPGEIPFAAGPGADSGYGKKSNIEKVLNGSNTEKSEIERQLAANDEKAERWFTKVSQLDDSSDLSSAIADEDFPEIMPLRKGVNRFVVSTRKTPLERRLANAQFRQNVECVGSLKRNDSVSGDVGGVCSDKISDSSISRSLDRMLGRSSSMPGTNNVSNDVSAAGESNTGNENMFTSSERKDSGYVSLVPSPADSFDKFEKFSTKQKQSSNRDRSLPQYQKRLAMEQDNSSNFVPFVPFPPGYFARKGKQAEGATSTENPEAQSATSTSENIHCVPEKLEESKAEDPSWGDTRNLSLPENSGVNRESWNPEFYGRNLSEGKGDAGYGQGISSTQQPNNKWDNYRESSRSGFSQGGSVDCHGTTGGSMQHLESPKNSREGLNRGFSGKSLEGSAVQEPDPLDMSEEAKAQRWFRRVAQIKDISELSQIPDEDFPEIMPMRKGVNRFVVSKRKTPLERRLTSPQYRRNLPVVSSEPEKDASSE